MNHIKQSKCILKHGKNFINSRITVQNFVLLLGMVTAKFNALYTDLLTIDQMMGNNIVGTPENKSSSHNNPSKVIANQKKYTCS